MEHLKIKTQRLVVMVLFLMGVIHISAQRVVCDYQAIYEVGKNTAAIEGIEATHNSRLDSISKTKQKIAAAQAGMATIREAYKMSMQNIKGFGQETTLYKEIALLSFEILKETPSVIRDISRSPAKNYILALDEIGNIVLETEGLVNTFINVVNNGKVVNPLEKNQEKADDGYNFLDRYQRLGIANLIYSRLSNIKWNLYIIKAQCKYGTWNNAWYAIDPQGWAAVMTGKAKVTTLIREWNSL